MFKRIAAATLARRSVRITLDGIAMDVAEDETVAASMLQSGRADFRTTAVSGAHRGAYCMMGVCFDCLVTIDGQPNQQACMTQVRAGMRVERERGGGNILRFNASLRGVKA
jgi:D-hydroxyproline dehydrogenase subunit gamma